MVTELNIDSDEVLMDEPMRLDDDYLEYLLEAELSQIQIVQEHQLSDEDEVEIVLELDELDEVLLDELELEVIEQLELEVHKQVDEVEVMLEVHNSNDETEAEHMVIEVEVDGDEVMVLYEIVLLMMINEDEDEVLML